MVRERRYCFGCRRYYDFNPAAGKVFCPRCTKARDGRIILPLGPGLPGPELPGPGLPGSKGGPPSWAPE